MGVSRGVVVGHRIVDRVAQLQGEDMEVQPTACMVLGQYPRLGAGGRGSAREAEAPPALGDLGPIARLDWGLGAASEADVAEPDSPVQSRLGRLHSQQGVAL